MRQRYSTFRCGLDRVWSRAAAVLARLLLIQGESDLRDAGGRPSRSMTRLLAVLQLAEALMLVLALTVLPGHHHRYPDALVTLAATAAALGLAALLGGSLSPRAVQASLLFNTGVGAALIVTQRSNVYAFMFFVVVIFALCYLAPVAATVQIAVAALTHLCLLAFVRTTGLTKLEWLLTMAVLAVPSIAVAASRAALWRAKQALDGLLEAAPDAIVITDGNGRIVRVNPAVSRLFGYGAEDLLGNPVEMLMPERYRTAHRAHRAEFVAAGTTRPMGSGGGIVGQRRDGGEFPTGISLSPHRIGRQQLVIAVIRDESEHEQLLAAERAARIEVETLRDELALAAATDGLTGLLNRRELDAVARELIALSDRTGRPLTCLLVDLDNFKRINDTAGHLFGDAVLREVALRLRETTRGSDVVARYGGDEFVILLPDTGADQALTLAGALRVALVESRLPAGRRGLGAQELTLRASFGVAAYRSGMRTPSDLYAAADRALYAAKRDGRDRIEVAAA